MKNEESHIMDYKIKFFSETDKKDGTMNKIVTSYHKKMLEKNLKCYRFQKQLSQEKFSELTNSDITYIGDLESGKTGLHLKCLLYLQMYWMFSCINYLKKKI